MNPSISRKPADLGTGTLVRKPAGIAEEVTRSDGNGSHIIDPRRKAGRKRGKSLESRLHSVGNWVAPTDREIILSQLFRCLGKYDPRAIPRIVSKRTGITEQAVDYVLQHTCAEFREWSREIRAGIARADAAAAAVWQRKAS